MENIKKVREVAAYLFLTENAEDVNAMLSEEDVAAYITRASNLIACCNAINAMEEGSEKEMEAQIYEIGKKYYGTDKKILRNFFKDLYMLLFVKTDGPRLGVFVSLLGLENFKTRLNGRLQTPFMY